VSVTGLLVFLAVFAAVVTAGLYWDRRRRAPGPVPDPAPVPAEPAAACPVLTEAETAMLARLALRYAHGDPAAGRRLADYLRGKLPEVPDAQIARMLLALIGVARFYTRTQMTAGDAVAAYLHAMGSAALDLTVLERDEIPR
jgi:hypothetical protein